jgi:hypothetical protein
MYYEPSKGYSHPRPSNQTSCTATNTTDPSNPSEPPVPRPDPHPVPYPFYPQVYDANPSHGSFIKRTKSLDANKPASFEDVYTITNHRYQQMTHLFDAQSQSLDQLAGKVTSMVSSITTLKQKIDQLNQQLIIIIPYLSSQTMPINQFKILELFNDNISKLSKDIDLLFKSNARPMGTDQPFGPRRTAACSTGANPAMPHPNFNQNKPKSTYRDATTATTVTSGASTSNYSSFNSINSFTNPSPASSPGSKRRCIFGTRPFKEATPVQAQNSSIEINQGSTRSLKDKNIVKQLNLQLNQQPNMQPGQQPNKQTDQLVNSKPNEQHIQQANQQAIQQPIQQRHQQCGPLPIILNPVHSTKVVPISPNHLKEPVCSSSFKPSQNGLNDDRNGIKKLQHSVSDTTMSTEKQNKVKNDGSMIRLERSLKTVADVWKEYEYGIKDKPPLKDLEIKFGAKWRNGTESRTFLRRKKIYEAVQYGKEKGHSEHEIIAELELHRSYSHNGQAKRKPLLWLCRNIPEKYIR